MKEYRVCKLKPNHFKSFIPKGSLSFISVIMIKYATCCFYCSSFQHYTSRTMTFTMLKFPFTTVYITYYLQSLHCLPFSVD